MDPVQSKPISITFNAPVPTDAPRSPPLPIRSQNPQAAAKPIVSTAIEDVPSIAAKVEAHSAPAISEKTGPAQVIDQGSARIFHSIENVTRSMAKNDAAKPWSGLNRTIDTSISNVIGKRLEQAIASESKRADGSIRVTTSMGTTYCLYPRKDGQPSNPMTCD